MTAWVNVDDGDTFGAIRIKKNQVGALAYQSPETGLVVGCVVTINANPSLIDCTAGVVRVVNNYTNAELPNVVDVVVPERLGVTVPTLATGPVSRVKIDAAGDLSFSNDPLTDDDYRDFAPVANLLHFDGVNITEITPTPYNPIGASTFVQFLNIFGGLNVSGNVYAGVNADLAVSKSPGSAWDIGANYSVDPKNPNIAAIPAQFALPFFQVYDDGSGSALTTVAKTLIDPLVVDDGTGTLDVYSGGGGQATLRYIYLFPGSNATVIRVGTTVFANLDAALAAALTTEVPFVLDDFRTRGILRSVLAVTKGATSLIDLADANFTALNTVRIG